MRFLPSISGGYEKFSDSNSGGKHVSPQPRGRSRESSRIPKKSLARILKNRKLRQFVRKYISKNFTKSSSIHKNTSAYLFQRLSMNGYSDNCKRFSLTSRRIKTRCKQNQCKSRRKSPKFDRTIPKIILIFYLKHEVGNSIRRYPLYI